MNFMGRMTALVQTHVDKVFHAIVGLYLAMLGALVGLLYMRNFAWAMILSIIIPVAVLMGKEMWDLKHPPHVYDFWDFAWGILSALPVWLVLYFSKAAL